MVLMPRMPLFEIPSRLSPKHLLGPDMHNNKGESERQEMQGCWPFSLLEG
jgi:hypothetical protein